MIPVTNRDLRNFLLTRIFQKTMQLQMKEGRWFRDESGSDKKIYFEETAVKDFKLHIPAYRTNFYFQRRYRAKIIGVVKTLRTKEHARKNGAMSS